MPTHPPALYLIRHADAEEATSDAERPLSRRGHKQLQQLAQLLRASRAFAPEEIWHSPFVRARETASMLSRELGLEVPMKVERALIPEGDPSVIADRLPVANRRVALVGHEPHLSALASLLVAGDDVRPLFAMKKASVLALDRTVFGWSVRWFVTPELFGQTGPHSV